MELELQACLTFFYLLLPFFLTRARYKIQQTAPVGVENQIRGPFSLSYKQAIYMIPGMIRWRANSEAHYCKGPKEEYLVQWMESLYLVSGVETLI